MTRQLDLVDTINNRSANERLNAALFQNWEWQGHSRQEAFTKTAEERRLRRRKSAEQYGINLRYDGD